jgi:hypothetical protein
MVAPNAPIEDTENGLVQRSPRNQSQSLWSVPLESLITTFLNNRDAIRRFLSLTGGSILYCLSALSIVYGIAQIIGAPLAKSSVLGDILPCVMVLSIYELALLAVLVLIVVWRNVTDDAISLVILVALFLVASGMTLGVVAPSGLDICLTIGVASAALGLVKLYVLRRYISLRIGVLSVLGLAIILAWNFLGSSLMARPIMARTATDELRRSQWLFGWLVLLIGAALVLVEAASREYPRSNDPNGRIPFLHRHSMVWMFALVLLAAVVFHQYGVAYMFAVDYVYGDFIPLIAVMSLLLVEFIRSLGKRYEGLEAVLACLPAGLTVLAVPNKMTAVPSSIGIEAMTYPPVVLGLTGLALLWMGWRHRWNMFRYVAIVYALCVLLTLSRGHELNVKLFGVGLVVTFLILGAVLRSVSLCFAGVIALAVGAGMTDMLARFARAHDLTVAGATLGLGGLAIMVIALAFGRRTPAAFVLIGTLSMIACVFDYLPRSLHWVDLAVLAAIGVLFAALILRTKDIAPPLVLWIPVLPRAYLFVTTMSSWNFVVLSFLLLFLGALTSLFLKRKLLPDDPSPVDRAGGSSDTSADIGEKVS